ncbi:DUF276 domain-containing protein [Borrelia miyamotoi]|uniref:DUF276 domain-containing protein n=1 Tax=Borrelia miyamotoi TaxID=47466 RepID=UPI003B281C88
MQVFALLKDTDETKISSINDLQFKENQDISIKPEELLIFSLNERLFIDITS